MIDQAASEEKIFEMVDDDGRQTDDGAWPSLGSSELKLIVTWHSLTPDPARSGRGMGGGHAGTSVLSLSKTF